MPARMSKNDAASGASRANNGYEEGPRLRVRNDGGACGGAVLDLRKRGFAATRKS